MQFAYLNNYYKYFYLFQIAKNRYSGDLGIMILEFNKDNLSYAQKKKPKTDTSEILEDNLPVFV